MTGVEYLQTLHTKQILNLKNEHKGRLRQWGGIGETYKGNDVVINLEDIKQVLSERPHIPRQLKAKRIRQIAAKSRVRAQSTPRESLSSGVEFDVAASQRDKERLAKRICERLERLGFNVVNKPNDY
jgi:hypothetical protein